MNKSQASAKTAEQAIDFHAALGRGLDEDFDTKLSDLLVDLAHLCAEKNLSLLDLVSEKTRIAVCERLDESLQDGVDAPEPLWVESGRVSGSDEDDVFITNGRPDDLRNRLLGNELTKEPVGAGGPINSESDLEDIEINSTFSCELLRLINDR